MKILSIIFGLFIYASLLYSSIHQFPDFDSSNCDFIGGEWVYTIDEFNGVPAYLNLANNGSGGSEGSFYQCTEFVGRYLWAKFGINYMNTKDITDSDTQGYEIGLNGFFISYSNIPLTAPWVIKNNINHSLIQVDNDSVQPGDVAVFVNPNHVAIRNTPNFSFEFDLEL